ncbi:inner membrane protein [Escherichia coli]|uniref:Probable membrane transporter protein n=1 Tax=Escherichia coli TaxID=562 RepID=A0A376U6V6_ECOLX|nr:inner membrane protein [Escherichia coli]
METFNSLFMVSPLLLGVLFFVAMLAGFIDSIAGGGGLLTIPALMAAGMSPANALATNKLQACGGSISATIYFIRRKVVSLSDQKLNIAMTFVGSMSGALLVQYVQADVLRQILPILVICIGLYFLLMPKLGEEDRQRRMYGLPFALIAGGCVGFYDGFFGPAAGSFYALAFVTLCGFNLAKATAHAKLLNANVKHWRSAAVYSRRQSDLGDGLCDAGGAVPRRAHGFTAGVEQRTKTDPPDDCYRLGGDECQITLR